MKAIINSQGFKIEKHLRMSICCRHTAWWNEHVQYNPTTIYIYQTLYKTHIHQTHIWRWVRFYIISRYHKICRGSLSVPQRYPSFKDWWGSKITNKIIFAWSMTYKLTQWVLNCEIINCRTFPSNIFFEEHIWIEEF